MTSVRASDYDSVAAAYTADNEKNLYNAYCERPATLALAGDVAGRRILDAGCGAGPLFAALRDRVRRMLREGFASRHARGIELVEGPLRARLRGMALDRPLHFDPELPETREPYREFASRAEIEEAKAAIDLAEAAGRLLIDRVGFPVAAVEEGATFSTLLSTALAWHAVTGEVRGEGLLADVASEFVRRFASKRTAEPGAVGGAMDAFVGELRETGALPAADVPAITLFARACVDRIEAECGGLDPAVPLTPLSVGCLWLARG